MHTGSLYLSACPPLCFFAFFSLSVSDSDTLTHTHTHAHTTFSEHCGVIAVVPAAAREVGWGGFWNDRGGNEVCVCAKITGVGSQTAGIPVRTGYDTALRPDKGRKQQMWCGKSDVFIERSSLLCSLTVWRGLSDTWRFAEDDELLSMAKQTHLLIRSH